MRGIILEQVAHVRLAGESDPAVQRFRTEMARRTTESLEQKYHERAQERARLLSVFNASLDDVLDIERLCALYGARFIPSRGPSCVDCQHVGEDRWRPGQWVCWRPWKTGLARRPRPLTTLTPCADFVPGWRRTEETRTALVEFLGQHGIHYSVARWRAHRLDVEREAGSWGFQAGQQWESRVRAWLTTIEGVAFRLERWLVITTRAGAQQFRQVDGIERVSAQAAFVYEIKRGGFGVGYHQLIDVYVPLLMCAFPHVTFVPLEINSEDPFRWHAAPGPLTQLETLSDRRLEAGPQLLVLPEARLTQLERHALTLASPL
jgi:hypothetical protein